VTEEKAKEVDVSTFLTIYLTARYALLGNSYALHSDWCLCHYLMILSWIL